MHTLNVKHQIFKMISKVHITTMSSTRCYTLGSYVSQSAKSTGKFFLTGHTPERILRTEILTTRLKSTNSKEKIIPMLERFRILKFYVRIDIWRHKIFSVCCENILGLPRFEYYHKFWIPRRCAPCKASAEWNSGLKSPSGCRPLSGHFATAE